MEVLLQPLGSRKEQWHGRELTRSGTRVAKMCMFAKFPRGLYKESWFGLLSLACHHSFTRTSPSCQKQLCTQP